MKIRELKLDELKLKLMTNPSARQGRRGFRLPHRPYACGSSSISQSAAYAALLMIYLTFLSVNYIVS